MSTNERAMGPSAGVDRVRGFTTRSVVVAILWILLVGWLNIRAEVLSLSLPLSYDSAPSGVGLLIILIMLALNGLFGQVLKRQFGFTQAEISVVYVMTMAGCILIGSGMISFLPGAMMTMNLPLSGVTYIPLNRWEPVYEDFYRLGTPMDEESSIAFWVGLERSNLQGIPWGQWLKMLPIWFIFFGSVYIMLISLANILRRRWLEAEFLTFPLATPVLTIANIRSDKEKEGSLKGGKLLWIGVILGAFPLIWNWLAKFYIHGMPRIPLQYNLYNLFAGASPPWNALGRVGWHRLYLQSDVNPLLLGTCYFVPLNVLSSIAFAQLIAQIFKVIAHSMGLTEMRGIYMFPIHFNAGGYLIVAASGLWLLRKEIKAMWDAAFRGGESMDDSEEGLSYKGAFLGIIIGTVVLLFTGVYFFRIPFIAMLLFVILVVAGAVGFSRSRGLVGNPGYPTVFVQGNTVELLGATPTLGYTGMAGTGYLRLFEDGAQLMPTAWALEAYKIGDMLNVRRKDMTLGLIVAFIVAFFGGFALILPPIYEWGAWNLRSPSYGSSILRVDAVSYTAFHFPYHQTAGTGIHQMQVVITFTIGALITLFFNVMQLKYVWWPLDSLGFALGNSPYWLQGRWVNALIMLIVKGLILRWGGRGSLMNLTPLFIGIIIGAAFAPLISGLVSLVILPG